MGTQKWWLPLYLNSLAENVSVLQVAPTWSSVTDGAHSVLILKPQADLCPSPATGPSGISGPLFSFLLLLCFSHTGSLLSLCECVRHIPALRALHGWSYLEVLLPGSHLTSFSYFSVLSLLLVRSSKSFLPLVQPHTPLYFSSWSLQLPIHYNVHLLILFSLLAVQSSLGISGQLAPGTSSDNKIHRCSSPFYNLCSICICQI